MVIVVVGIVLFFFLSFFFFCVGCVVRQYAFISLGTKGFTPPPPQTAPRPPSLHRPPPPTTTTPIGASSCVHNSNRYDPPKSEVTTPLRRTDWKVPHGSAMHALSAALDAAAAGSTMVRVRPKCKTDRQQKHFSLMV